MGTGFFKCFFSQNQRNWVFYILCFCSKVVHKKRKLTLLKYICWNNFPQIFSWILFWFFHFFVVFLSSNPKKSNWKGACVTDRFINSGLNGSKRGQEEGLNVFSLNQMVKQFLCTSMWNIADQETQNQEIIIIIYVVLEVFLDKIKENSTKMLTVLNYIVFTELSFSHLFWKYVKCIIWFF